MYFHFHLTTVTWTVWRMCWQVFSKEEGEVGKRSKVRERGISIESKIWDPAQRAKSCNPCSPLNHRVWDQASQDTHTYMHTHSHTSSIAIALGDAHLKTALACTARGQWPQSEFHGNGTQAFTEDSQTLGKSSISGNLCKTCHHWQGTSHLFYISPWSDGAQHHPNSLRLVLNP